MRLNPHNKKGKWTSLLFFLLLITVPFTTLFAQTASRISGTVVDSKGETVPGVTVKIKDKSDVVTTNISGAFSIVAKQGDVLVFSAISYITKEVTVTAEKTYKVQLEDANTSLKEVVVVEQRRHCRCRPAITRQGTGT